MSADVLREAAVLMRWRAERAEARRWYPSDHHEGMDEIPWVEIVEGLPGSEDEDPVNFFVESWPPAVALDVAVLLEVMAEDVGTSSLSFHSALAVASAYLGDQS